MRHAAYKQPVAIAALALLAWGCATKDSARRFGPDRITFEPTGQDRSSLIGRWVHVTGASSTTPSGSTTGTVTETTWEFRSDSSATRTVTTRNALGQVVGTDVARARWRLGIGVLTLEFTTPSSRVLSVSFAIDYDVRGTFLFLDGVQFTKA